MRLIPYALTDVGRKREHNEDSYLIAPAVQLFAVADGMGGHQAGERASRMAVQELQKALELPPPEATRDQVLEGLRTAMAQAGLAIFEAAQADADLAGMGTTLTAMLFFGGRAFVGHVGDSRAYLYRDGKAQQLTDDHSWVQEQVRAGLLTEEEAKESRFRHIITRSVGFEPDVHADGEIWPVQAGDCYLLCSDGLSNHVEAADMERLLSNYFYSEVPRLLVDLANERGGDDNITVVLVHVANDDG